MGAGELLDKIRDYYLDRLIEEANAIDSNKGLILEPAIRDSEGNVILEGFFNSGSKVDFAILENNEVIDSVNVDTEGMVSFNEIIFNWEESLEVVLSPFQWNYCSLEILGNSVNWKPIEKWYKDWFEEKPSENGSLFNCVHFISEPEPTNKGQRIYVDFGTAPVLAFEEILDSIIKAGALKVEIGSV